MNILIKMGTDSCVSIFGKRCGYDRGAECVRCATIHRDESQAIIDGLGESGREVDDISEIHRTINRADSCRVWGVTVTGRMPDLGVITNSEYEKLLEDA